MEGMCIKFRENKGVTLISLVIAIMVMAILSGTVIFNGSKAIQTSKKQRFVSELEMIQAKVNTISEKMKDSKTEEEYYTTSGTKINNLDQEKLKLIMGRNPNNGTNYTTEADGFLYFNESALDKIGISGITQSVLINFSTREVYSYIGLEQNGKMYYKLKDLGYNSWNAE